MKHRRIVGVITGHAGEYCTKQIVKGINQAGLNLNYDIVYFSNIYNIEKNESEISCENRIYDLALSNDIDGLILIPESIVNSDVRAEIAEKLSDISIPIVIIGEETPEFYGSKYPAIQNNESADMEYLTDHMLDEHGFHRIDLLTGSEGVKTTENRTEGFLSSMRKHNIDENLYNVYTGDYWYSSGEKLAAQYASGNLTMPEAVICASEMMGFGLLRGLAGHGIKVPQQIAVASYEYSDRRVYNRPLLTCLERNRTAIGKYGMEVLHSLINGAKSQKPPSFIGNMIHGESCGCVPDAEFLVTEYEDAAQLREMNDWNPLASLERGLISCQDMKSFISTLANFHWLIKGTDNAYLRLFSEWYDMEASETEAMYCHSILNQNDTEKLETSIYQISDLTSMTSKPSVWYFNPLFIGDRLFGNYVLQFSSPDCYDAMFRNWLKSVSACLEHLRMKNDIRYLLSVQSLSDEKDSITGMYNGNGIKKVFAQLKHEKTENLYCILIQSCLHHGATFDEGKKQKNRAVSLAAEAVAEFCRFNGTASHLGNGRFLCFVRYNADEILIKKVLQAFLLQCGTYTKEFGTDSFVYSVTPCMNAAYEKIVRQAEEEIVKLTSDYRQRAANAHYRKMLKLRNYIYMHPSETFSDEAVCNIMDERLALVRSVYGNCFSMTFHNDCINARISYAVYQLMTTSASGIDIAEQCGYQDSKYFLRQFSANIGMTITEFRKLCTMSN